MASPTLLHDEKEPVYILAYGKRKKMTSSPSVVESPHPRRRLPTRGLGGPSSPTSTTAQRRTGSSPRVPAPPRRDSSRYRTREKYLEAYKEACSRSTCRHYLLLIYTSLLALCNDSSFYFFNKLFENLKLQRSIYVR